MTSLLINHNEAKPLFDDEDIHVKDIQFESLISKRQSAAQLIFENKQQAQKITRKIPLQVFAAEWFSRIDSSTENRTYLMENFLPVLILGCENVLKEAQTKQLVSQNKRDPNFNPINVLAQYLMRNNPKFNNQNEGSPYVRKMREVYQELKEQMNAIQGNKLSKLKEDVRRRRHERERNERLRQLEIGRRKKQLEEAFKRFCLPSNGRLELDLIFATFRLYEDHIINLPEDMRKLAQLKLDALPALCYARDEIMLDKRLLLNEFSECVLSVTEHLKSDLFNVFNEFFEECAIYFVYLANLNSFYRIIKHLIKLLDSTKTGLLSRRRLLSIFQEFREKRAKNRLRNPFDWPVLDTFIKFENKLEAAIPPLLTKENTKITIGESVPDDIKPSLKTSIKDVIDLHADEAALAMAIPSVKEEAKSETTKQALTQKEPEQNKELDVTELLSEKNEKINAPESNQENPTPPQTAGTPKSVRSSSENADKTSDTDQADKNAIDTSRIEPLPLVDSLVSARPQTSTMTSLSNPVRPVITKNNELLFLKGGSLYYVPLSEPIHAFDKTLLAEPPNEFAAEPSSPSTKESDILTDFDPEFLTPKQALNLINNFISQYFIDSEINVNDLIVFIKDNYAENSIEKSAKLEKLAQMRKHLARSARFAFTFDKLDNECRGILSLNKLIDAMVGFKDGLYKEQVLNAANVLKDQILLNGKPDDFINREEFINYVSILINSCDFPRFEDQVANYLNGIISYDYVERTRGELRRTWLNQIKYVGDIICGSFEPLYKQLFLTLLKDAENHGQGKRISAYVAILERLSTEDESSVLKYHATTPHDSNFVLGKTLTRNDKNISFNVIDKGRFEHIPKVRANSSVHFFNENSIKDGSLVIYPLHYARNKIFGTIGIDTLQEPSKNCTFLDNEIGFYQGVANTFANAYASIIFKNRLLKACISAIEWLGKRCTGIEFCNIYLVQLLDDQANINEDILPRNQIPNKDNATNSTYSVNLKPVIKYKFSNDGCNPKEVLLNQQTTSNKLEYKIGSKAYECALISETTVEYFNGNASFYVPLRNDEHKTMFVFEITSKNYHNSPENYEEDFEQIETVLYAVHKCQEELLDERFSGLVKHKFDFEALYEQDKFELLFEKSYLNHILGMFLDKFANQEIVELMPDGSRSIEDSQAQNLIKLIADLVADEELAKTNILNENVLNSLKTMDPTVQGFKFKASTSSFKISSDDSMESLNELHSFYKSLTRLNKSLRLLIDWVCLIKQVHNKSKIIIKNFKN